MHLSRLSLTTPGRSGKGAAEIVCGRVGHFDDFLSMERALSCHLLRIDHRSGIDDVHGFAEFPLMVQHHLDRLGPLPQLERAGQVGIESGLFDPQLIGSRGQRGQEEPPRLIGGGNDGEGSLGPGSVSPSRPIRSRRFRRLPCRPSGRFVQPPRQTTQELARRARNVLILGWTTDQSYQLRQWSDRRASHLCRTVSSGDR